MGVNDKATAWFRENKDEIAEAVASKVVTWEFTSAVDGKPYKLETFLIRLNQQMQEVERLLKKLAGE